MNFFASLEAFGEHIDQSQIGVSIAESRYWWAIFEGTHLLSLAVSFGLLLLTDLRLMGLMFRQVPVRSVLEQLRPYVLGGFAVTFISGGMVFWSEASTVMASPLWVIKTLLILLGALNACYFEFVTAKRPDVLDGTAKPAPAVRFAGLASLTIWSLAIVCGRLLAYLPR